MDPLIWVMLIYIAACDVVTYPIVYLAARDSIGLRIIAGILFITFGFIIMLAGILILCAMEKHAGLMTLGLLIGGGTVLFVMNSAAKKAEKKNKEEALRVAE